MVVIIIPKEVYAKAKIKKNRLDETVNNLVNTTIDIS